MDNVLDVQIFNSSLKDCILKINGDPFTRHSYSIVSEPTCREATSGRDGQTIPTSLLSQFVPGIRLCQRQNPNDWQWRGAFRYTSGLGAGA